MLCKIVRPLTSNPAHPAILIPEAIKPVRCHGVQVGTRTQGARHNDTETLTTGNNTWFDRGGDLVRQARYTVTDRTLRTDRRGTGGEGSIYYNNTTPYNSSSTPFLAIRLTLHSCTNRARSAIQLTHQGWWSGQPGTRSVQLGAGAPLQLVYIIQSIQLVWL